MISYGAVKAGQHRYEYGKSDYHGQTTCKSAVYTFVYRPLLLHKQFPVVATLLGDLVQLGLHNFHYLLVLSVDSLPNIKRRYTFKNMRKSITVMLNSTKISTAAPFAYPRIQHVIN